MAKGNYNFRYQSERERFYEDIKSQYKSVASGEEGIEDVSGLRIVFEFGGTTKKQRLEQEKSIQDKDANAFRGLRTFKDLRRLRQFLTSRNEGGSGVSWGRQNLAGEQMTVAVRSYDRRGQRITGEKTFWKADICTKQDKGKSC